MSRISGSNGERLSRTERDITDIKRNIQDMNQKISELQQQQESQIERNILDDLDAETFYNSGRPLYTYDDIAERWGVTRSKVQKTAERAALEGKTRRRGKRIV